MEEILKSYLRRLTNLSGNNRSLLLLKLTTEQFMDVHDFDYALKEPSFKILEKIIARKTNIPLCTIQDSRDGDSNKLSKRLKKLTRIDNLVYEERGARDLYLGWPIVKGKFSDGTIVRCPLMFFPVSITSDHKNWLVHVRKDVNITMNKSFLLAYAYFNGLTPNETLLERVFDDFDRESTGFKTDLYELLKKENLEVNFNQDNFQDVLKSFDSVKKLELENFEKEGELKLFPQAIIGIFPQAGSYLVPDYMTMLERPPENVESFFKERNLDTTDDLDTSYYRFLKKVKEDQTYAPFKLDAYQENALKAIKKGNSAVVQGPPGTGKSQLICNLIADYIARGKNVLLVSQKRAALDVVFERLEEKQLGEFLGLLHDFKNDRKPIYQQIEKQISHLEDYRSMNNSLDAIQIERNFLKTSRLIDQLEEELEEFKAALFDTTECGHSIKELYLTSSPHRQSIPLNQEYRFFKVGDISAFKRKLKYYSIYAEQFENENHPWFRRLSFASYGVKERQVLSDYINEIEPYINVLEIVTKKAVGKKILFGDVAEIIRKKSDIVHLASLLKDKQAFRGLVKLLKSEPNRVEKKEIAEIEKTTLQFFDGEGPELSLESQELGRFQEVLERGLAAKGNLLKWFWWKFFSKDKIFITRVLVANKLKNSREAFNILVEKVDNRLNLEHNLTGLIKLKGLLELPSKFRKIDIQNWFFYQKQAIEARDLLRNIRQLNDYISAENLDGVEYVKKLESLLVALEPIEEKLSHWEKYFSIAHLRQIFGKHVDMKKLDKSLHLDFDSLCEYDKLKEELSHEEKRVIEKIQEELPSANADQWVKLFDNSLKLAWIDHIEIKYPVLRTVSSQKFEQMQLDLQNAVSEKFRLSNEILLIKSRERVYKNVEYNRLNNMVTYRDVYHQVTKKRRIWPVRKLIANYPREIFDLIPCWLASPESASAIFPMEKVFDLVIFDEASQCFVEKGIPAMYRGKQVVVAGDSKQLKPNDLYQVRWEEENQEEIPELDFDSLLNLAGKHLMQVQLNGHYRSKNLDLIRFSNEHFYDNRLDMLPDCNDLNQGDRAIEYIKVEGVWHKNKNKVEADRIVELVKQLLELKPNLEIGIVTFNVQQQLHIIGRLEEYSVEKNIILPDNLIVKNIENIQGDEKDVIIFSTVYAPDSSGRMIMNFGSLNTEGGENRLNVAITRAREKIYLVTSIFPQQLNVEQAKYAGPRLLKKYLEFAFKVFEGNTRHDRQTKFEHSKNWYLSAKIKDIEFNEFQHVDIDSTMPYMDLAIQHKDNYIGGLLTDDELYHGAISVKASHVYKHYILKFKNWNYLSLFSRQYWSNPDHLRDQIKRLIGRNIKEEDQ
ncbi:AAA domain-containing protein [Reichenbachiella versicolor]|uniref:AAA domain-containing protein n=1 Tax=Reichenbachiella versicolor TaxID=1821036 RepID=UPI000D6E0646|nr:AAA domain-containing protein [Reichenbachiella versicolor]